MQVTNGLPTVLQIGYTLAQPAPAGVSLPVPVPPAEMDNLTSYPFGFNGQLETDVGYGSGVAVLSNVVLTAAHLIFNDQTLSYVSQAYWFNDEETGVFAPDPMPARGWYVLSGYASRRTNDLMGGLAPDQSSPQARNLDVAALYFSSPVVAGGGYGGYLPSDTTPNEWLSSSANKMLVGYPVDGSQFGFTNIVPGQMYQTGPQRDILTMASDPVSDQQVYVATWMLSYPGNSGGPPLCPVEQLLLPGRRLSRHLVQRHRALRLGRSRHRQQCCQHDFSGAGSGRFRHEFSGGGVITVAATPASPTIPDCSASTSLPPPPSRPAALGNCPPIPMPITPPPPTRPPISTSIQPMPRWSLSRSPAGMSRPIRPSTCRPGAP